MMYELTVFSQKSAPAMTAGAEIGRNAAKRSESPKRTNRDSAKIDNMQVHLLSIENFLFVQ